MATGIDQELYEKISFVYGNEKAEQIYKDIEKLIEKYEIDIKPSDKGWVDEQDVMLITYGDTINETGKAPLQSLHEFLNHYTKDFINSVHILPFYPYTSDDGFSVVDYKAVNPELGNWEDIANLSNDYYIMFDAVINHISKKSNWFQEYEKGNPEFREYFIEADPTADYSTVTRPRALPLLTKFQTAHGDKYIWTTFSDDQIDLNFKNERVLLEVIDILLFYVKMGARFIRLDAIGYLWKRLGTSCIHLEETHVIIQVIRKIMDKLAPGTVLITETNVPHKDNISYFGNGYNEAHLVYQFPLPPLTLQAILTGSSKYLSEWANSLEKTTERTTFFNFLSSHDGIGVRPVDGILSDEEVEFLLTKVREHGGFVSYKDNGDGTKSPYELNINYFDALSNPNDEAYLKVKRFVAANSILLSLAGVPGIYIHSLLGSRSDLKGVEKTGRYRSINREKLIKVDVEKQLADPTSLRFQVFHELKQLINIRIKEAAFHPNGEQNVLFLDSHIFALQRTSIDGKEKILSLTNVSNNKITLNLETSKLNNQTPKSFTNLLTNEKLTADGENPQISFSPYQVIWLKYNEE